MTLGLLFAPKLFGLALALVEGARRRALGGAARLTLSALLETLYSAFLAPIMMLFHTSFVLHDPARDRDRLGPAEAQRRPAGLLETARRFGRVTVIGVIASVATYWAHAQRCSTG